jgi:N-acetyl-anhydromuramyl-L-alanine amidase AmpD
MLKSKKGQILTVYWFVIIFIVAAAVVYMAFSFYGSPFDVRTLEGRALGNQVANCLTSQGYLNEQIFQPDFQKNFLSNCNLNLTTEDFSDWKTIPQYYLEVEAYKFSPGQQSYGETGNAVSSIYGNLLANFSFGNINLKTSWELINANPDQGILSVFIPKRSVTTIVIHDTEGPTALGAIEAISTADLSIHYIIDRDGTIISPNNVNQFAPAQYTNALVPESTIAQDAGCYDTRSKTQWPPCTSSCISDGLIATSCQKLSNPPPSSLCCIEENLKSIGIELVNTGTDSYPDAQIKSLVNLVSDISSRYNIPLDRSHIVGHYQTSSYKVDPGTQFPWDNFMQELNSRGPVTLASSGTILGQQQRNFYAVDKSGNQYIIQVLTLVGKSDKNA